MSTLSFKYQPLSETGVPQGWFAKKGRLEEDVLILDGERIDAKSIMYTILIEKAFALTYPGNDREARVSTLLIKAGNANELKREIDSIRSRAQVGKAEAEWLRSGKTGAFRKETCPNCRATLDLSRFDVTPQLYCDYCDTIYTVPMLDETPKNEGSYRLCEHCGMYAKPQPFTEFYFYFLLVVYGFWSKKSLRCPACMRGTAWKMLAANLLFVLGIIPSIYQLIRAHGSDRVAGAFSGLHGANLKATRRNYGAATKVYQSILDKVPVAAGIHYNLGLALSQNLEWERAAAAFELSLDDCSNYRYAAGGLIHCYEQLDRKDELAALMSQWGTAND